MSEKQVSMVEQLLDVISTSQSQHKEEVDPECSTDNACFLDTLDKEDKINSEDVQGMTQTCETNTKITDQDFIACHEFLSDSVNMNRAHMADTGNRPVDKVHVNDLDLDCEVQNFHLITNSEAVPNTIKRESKERLGSPENDNFKDDLLYACDSELGSKGLFNQTQNVESAEKESFLPTLSFGYSSNEPSKTGLNKDLNLSGSAVTEARNESTEILEMDVEQYKFVNQVKKDGETQEILDNIVIATHSGCKSDEAKVIHMETLMNKNSKVDGLYVQSQCHINQGSEKMDAIIYEDLQLELKNCKEELVSTKSQLAKATRQLEKANNYNEDLRKQMESLSAEIHRYRHRTTTDLSVQVDKEDLMNYTAGMMVMPDWGTTEKTITTEIEVNMEQTSNQHPGLTYSSGTSDIQAETGETVSIAESLKATAEAVVLQQSGFVYDENSGLYYDYNTGYYYDNEKSLYYDPNSGTYFYYNHETKEYQFHSQVDVTCYQRQHQSQTANLSHDQSGATTLLGENKQPAKQSVINQPQIVSKEKMKKRERNRKKERKKEKEKDEQVNSEDLDEMLSSFEDLKISMSRKHALELAGGWPPCIRVMVTESNCLSVGTLFIVTCTGATIGREKDMNHAIRIPDINVSKMHAEFQFDSVKGQYIITDRGSQNGTYINDHRIVEGKGKETSSSSPIQHGDVLQLGDTKLLCHIHSGTDTCDWCEPGIVIANHIAKQPLKKITILTKEEKKQQQKHQLKEIKKKYGLKNAAYVDNSAAINNPLYTDKASERRKTVGSDSPEIVRHKAPASVHRPISSENIGHKLLKKMGWSEGESLGKENTGIQEPVTVSLRANQTAGLGSSAGVFSPDDANSLSVKKAARRVQAQQRFNKLQTEEIGNQADKNRTQTDANRFQTDKKQWTKGETQYAEGRTNCGAD